MKELVIEIRIQIPDGTAVSVGNGATHPPQVAPDAPVSHASPSDDPPWPDMVPDAVVAFPDAVLHDAPHVVSAPPAPPGSHHGLPWKYVPAGTSARTGKPYAGFWACAQRDCNVKPPRAA